MGSVLYFQLDPRDVCMSNEAYQYFVEEVEDLESLPELMEEDEIREDTYVFKDLSQISETIEFILENGSDLIERISFPRLENSLEQININYKKVEKLFLIVSSYRKSRKSGSQRAQRGRYNKRGDHPYLVKKHTSPLFGLLKQCIIQKYKGEIQVELISIKEHHEHFRKVYEIIEKEFGRKRHSHKDKMVFLTSKGLLESVNVTLFQFFTFKFRNFIHLQTSPIDDGAYFSDIPKVIQRKFYSELLKEYTLDYKYGSALDITNSGLQSNNSLIEYVTLGHDLLSLNFKKAYDTIRLWEEELENSESAEDDSKDWDLETEQDSSVMEYEDQDPDIKEDILNDVSDLKIKEKQGRLIILYLAARAKYEQNEFTDFLVRIFTLSESLFISEIENFMKQELNITLDEGADGADSFNSIKSKWIRYRKDIDLEDRPLNVFLNNRGMSKGQNFNWRYTPPVIYRFLEEEKGRIEDEINQFPIMKLFEAIRPLADLRNQVAHNLKGASIIEIETELEKALAEQLSIEFLSEAKIQEEEKRKKEKFRLKKEIKKLNELKEESSSKHNKDNYLIKIKEYQKDLENLEFNKQENIKLTQDFLRNQYLNELLLEYYPSEELSQGNFTDIEDEEKEEPKKRFYTSYLWKTCEEFFDIKYPGIFRDLNKLINLSIEKQ
ncbi:MAG: hypothetical protein AAFQ92_14025 [Bacteroidota bacterium]